MSDVIGVRAAVLAALLAEAQREPEIECCGLLAGHGGIISVLLPAKNALRSATQYEIAPAELFSFFRRMRAERLDHLGVYHSHPRGENFPSPSDIERAFYPSAAYFIVSSRADAPRPIRAFRIVDGQARELMVEPM